MLISSEDDNVVSDDNIVSSIKTANVLYIVFFYEVFDDSYFSGTEI